MRHHPMPLVRSPGPFDHPDWLFGRSEFDHLMFRRDWLSFAAFDLLEADGENLRERPLVPWKRISWK